MPKITRGGGPTNAAATLRALGKLGPYGQPAESTPEPEPAPAVVGWTADPEAPSPWGSEAEVVDEPDAGAGAAVNADTGVVTEPGEPLPEIALEPDAVPLDPAPSVDNAQVRAWAAKNDIKVAGRGKIPQHVVDQYLAAREG